MTAVPFLDLAVTDDAAVSAAIDRVLASGTLILGPEVDAFESEFAAFIGSHHAVGVDSGTSAIELVLRALDIGPGDEVLVPAYTAVATWMAVLEAGATPVGVDVMASTALMNPDLAAAAMTSRTKAAIGVHLFGRPLNVDALRGAIGGLPLIEDTAQAHGAARNGRMAGAAGIAGTFSFYPTKNLGALGDGGAVVTDDDAIAERVRLLRSYGWRDRSESIVIGGNHRLDELQAAVLRERLRRLPAANARRQKIAGCYLAELAGLPGIALPPGPETDSVWHLFVLQADEPEFLIDRLGRRGVTALRHYVPLPHQTKALRGHVRAGAFPTAEGFAAKAVSLPLFADMDEEAVATVIAAVRDTGGHAA